MRRLLKSSPLLLLALTALACHETSTKPKPNCQNGVLDAGELCDGELFAAGKRVCPEGTTGDVSQITCSQSCTLLTETACKKADTPSACKGKPATCEGSVLLFCDKGEEKRRDCHSESLFCDKTRADCVASLCLSNQLKFFQNGQEQSLNCSAQLQICDREKQRCVPAESFSCTDDHLAQFLDSKGQRYQFDCREQESAVACNPSLGCAEAFCKGKILMQCDKESKTCIEREQCSQSCDNAAMACVEEDACQEGARRCHGDILQHCSDASWKRLHNCKDFEASCSPEAAKCIVDKPCSKRDELVCEGEIFKSCLESIDGQLAWLTEDCSALHKRCDPEQGCVEKIYVGCGNDFIDSGEQCDGKANYKSCKDFDPNKNWRDGGKPGCTATCTLTQGTCTERGSSEILKIEIKDQDSFNAFVKDRNRVRVKGGFQPSRYEFGHGHHAWLLGQWSTANSADFNNRYVELVVGDVTAYSQLNFNVAMMRNQNGPKSLQVAVFKGNTLQMTSAPVSVGSSFSNHSLSINTTKIQGAVTLRIHGFKAGSSTGTLRLANMSISGYEQ